MLTSWGTTLQSATTLEWLYRKGLLASNEFTTGQALALLIEWRIASYCPPDSTVVFARKLNEARPHQITPIEADGDEAALEAAYLDTVSSDPYNETIAERLFRNIASAEELFNIEWLFRKALPGRPDLMVILGQAVINRLGIREVPYADVPLICSALYVLKEFWRERLLARNLNDAVSCIAKEVRRPELISAGESRSALAA